jgi:hypothetical protein
MCNLELRGELMRTRIFCAHAGGQGKTTSAQVVSSTLRDRGIEVKLAAADFIDETGSSKFGRLFGDEVQELGTGPDVTLAKQVNDLNANVRYWDCLGPIFLKGEHVLDMGANVIDQILHWGKVRQAPKLLESRSAPPIDAYLVCKAEQRAVDDMSDLVKRFTENDSLPADRVYIVLNEQIGDFTALDIKSKIAKAVHKDAREKMHFLTLPACSSELWVPMEQTYTSVETALAMDDDELQSKLGVEFWSILSGRDDLQDWYSTVQMNMKSAGII